MQLIREGQMTGRPEHDPGEFSEWVAARLPALSRFAFLITGSGNDAQDLVQEALIRAYPRWKQLSAADTTEAYVRRSIVNGSVSRWRKARRLVVVEDVSLFTDRGTPDPAVRISDADAAWRLCRELPVRQRAAVILRFYDDLSFSQIGVILDCPESTARSLVHRAVAALRSRLDTVEASHE